LPLALYLLSFILCFDGDGWYKREWFLRLLALMLASMAYALYSNKDLPIYVTLPLFSIGLFVCCMVCHGELARLKPDPRYLTLFYLMISVGGAIGGVFVGLVVPNLFSGYYELPLALVFCAALIVDVLRRDVFAGPGWSFGWIASLLYVVALTGYVGRELKTSFVGYRVSVRNFYGGLKVNDVGSGRNALRTLTHGTINH